VNNGSISISYAVPSGAPATIGISIIQRDQFGDETLCMRNVTSSSGSIDCTYNSSLGDSYIDLVATKNGNVIVEQSYILPEEGAFDCLGNNYFIVVILLLSIVGMAFSSPVWIILNRIVTCLS